MSDALDYLMKVRPEAMRAYFDFVRASGRHLDEKTRAIISVITKVDRQTEAGFRQYLKRALGAGVSADEMLDALLAAFPTLGLSKIVWALDRLLEMDLPEFRPENLDTGAAWHEIGGVRDLEDRSGAGVQCDGRRLFLYRDGADVRVYDAICPHRGTLIPDQALEGCVLTCPGHGWKFDLASGDCIERGDQPLRRLECRLEGGRCLVRW